MATSVSPLSLTSDDWSSINTILTAYNVCSNHCKRTRLETYSLSKTSLIDFLNDEQEMYRSLIQFYRQIPAFQQIHVDDEIHLIHIAHVLKDNFLENPRIALHMSEWIDSSFHQQMSKARHSYDYFIQHPIVLKLALVPLMFSANLSRLPSDQFSCQLLDQHLITQHQNTYITLLWKYLHAVYEEQDARQAIQILTFQYLRYQLLMEQMGECIVQQTDLDRFQPLTKAVLCLTH